MMILESDRNFIEIQGLTHRYGEVVALDDFSLSVSKGETLAVIGPDGVGKSTLLGVIAGIKRLQIGRLWVMGRDFSRENQREEVRAVQRSVLRADRVRDFSLFSSGSV